MLPTKKGIRDAALDKMSDVIINDVAAGTKERNELLSVYNDQIKDKNNKIKTPRSGIFYCDIYTMGAKSYIWRK